MIGTGYLVTRPGVLELTTDVDGASLHSASGEELGRLQAVPAHRRLAPKLLQLPLQQALVDPVVLHNHHAERAALRGPPHNVGQRPPLATRPLKRPGDAHRVPDRRRNLPGTRDIGTCRYLAAREPRGDRQSLCEFEPRIDRF